MGKTRRGRRSHEASNRRLKKNVDAYNASYVLHEKYGSPLLYDLNKRPTIYTGKSDKAKTPLPNWIKDAIPIDSERNYYGKDWPQIREWILRRDNYICQEEGCNITEGLHVHHIIPFKLSHSNEVDNLIALCSKHHVIHESERKGV